MTLRRVSWPARSLLTTGLFTIAAAVSITLARAHLTGAQQPTEPPGAGAASLSTVPPDPAFDARLRDYLQKQFMINDPGHIQLGPMIPTAMRGMVARPIRVTNDKGQAVTAEMFTNASHDQIILGQMYDLTHDPWAPIDLSKLHLQDRPVMGPPDAPVTVVEFADFECPFCARAFGILETMVHTTYKDKMKVFFKNYPLNSHPWAIRAAEGAECARLQNPDAFWDFGRAFYAEQGAITPANIDDHIHQAAKRLSLDRTTLDACMAAKTTADRIDEDQRDGNGAGVESTPTFFVNGVRVVGLPDDKSFDWVVNRQIAESGKKSELLRR